ncbi:MAG: hypothetical protein P8Z37_11655 [Acidobacteriota bacterium]
MSLYGSIKSTQKTIEKLYLNMEERFIENKAIRKIWSEMARDVSQQIDSLHELPRTFWIRLKKEQAELLNIIQKEIILQTIGNKEDLSLSECIERAIKSEEALIMKVYVPLIRKLRENWSGRELDFYIMVKAHIVRFKRVADSYSGDPTVLQEAALLAQKFEKEVQEPEIDINKILKPARKAKPIRRKPASSAKKIPTKKAAPKKAARTASSSKTGTKQSRSPINRSRRRANRSKPLAEKTELRRKRARR